MWKKPNSTSVTRTYIPTVNTEWTVAPTKIRLWLGCQDVVETGVVRQATLDH